MAEETTGIGNVGELEAEIARLKEENSRLKGSNRRWMRIAGTEDLTGLPNKVYFPRPYFRSWLAPPTRKATGWPVSCWLQMA